MCCSSTAAVLSSLPISPQVVGIPRSHHACLRFVSRRTSEVMAFVGVPSLGAQPHATRGCRCASRPRRAMACEKRPAAESRAAVMPSSLSDACRRAGGAVRAAVDAGRMRVTVELDPSAGDETYTLLKRSIPIARQVCEAMRREGDGDVLMLLPDAGAAALARRDIADGESLRLEGMEEGTVHKDAAAVAVVAPRASEVEALREVAERALEAGVPLVVLNADLVDMGVTGLSLNARRLRKQLLDTFEAGFVLRLVSGGVLLREWPGTWDLWEEHGDGFRWKTSFDAAPNAEQMDEALFGDSGGGASVMDRLRGFLRVYMRG